VLDSGEVDGIPWLSMEFVDGMVLREWLKVAGGPQLLEPVPEDDAPEGVDLDVLFEEPDSGALLAVARARRLKLETGFEAMLTPEEQAEQNNVERLWALCEALDRRSDIYSLGASLWELLAGRPAFAHANQFELLQAIIYQPPPDLTRINPGAPGALCRLAERMIAKRPEDRPENAAEVALLLRAIGRGVAGISEPLLVRPPREERA